MDTDQKPSLTWASAAKIAWRELQASRAKFLFVIVSVAIGVAALTGVRGFSDSFQKTLLGEARTIMAADLSARMFRQPTQEEEQQLNVMASSGIQRTQVTDTVSMVSSPGDPVPLLVSLKAVDPHQYPFYGTVDLEPAGDLRQVLTDSTVVVADDLLIRLHTQVGASLKIGDNTFRIAAILVREPDRMSSGMGLGPRVMMTQSALEKSGLMQQGSRSGERFLFKLSRNRQHRHGARPPGTSLTRCAGDRLPGEQSGVDRRLEAFDRPAQPDLPGSHGAGRDRCGHGHARASAATG